MAGFTEARRLTRLDEALDSERILSVFGGRHSKLGSHYVAGGSYSLPYLIKISECRVNIFNEYS